MMRPRLGGLSLKALIPVVIMVSLLLGVIFFFRPLMGNFLGKTDSLVVSRDQNQQAESVVIPTSTPIPQTFAANTSPAEAQTINILDNPFTTCIYILIGIPIAYFLGWLDPSMFSRSRE